MNREELFGGGVEQPDATRRRALSFVVETIGGLGVAGALWPFVASCSPSERARSAGGPVTVDIGRLQLGQLETVSWRGKPVWIFKRSAEALAGIQDAAVRARLRDPDSSVARQQPSFAVNEFRARKPEIGVLLGLCTHLGCIPTFRAGTGARGAGEFFCPCHGSRFDLAGRVHKGVPAPTNLVVPPYRYTSQTVIEIGVMPEVA